MADPRTTQPMGTRHSEQNILNHSFDDDFGLLIIESVIYDARTDSMVRSQGLIASKYAVNAIDDYTTTSVTYICKEGASTADWWIVKIDETGNFATFTHATVTNNPTVTTYAAAYAARATTLVFGNYNTAF